MKNIYFIIIKRGRHYKGDGEWFTPYQSNDPSPKIPIHIDRKKWNEKIVEDKKR